MWVVLDMEPLLLEEKVKPWWHGKYVLVVMTHKYQRTVSHGWGVVQASSFLIYLFIHLAATDCSLSLFCAILSWLLTLVSTSRVLKVTHHQEQIHHCCHNVAKSAKLTPVDVCHCSVMFISFRGTSPCSKCTSVQRSEPFITLELNNSSKETKKQTGKYSQVQENV